MAITNDEFVKIIKTQKSIKIPDPEKHLKEAEIENISLFNYLVTNEIIEKQVANEAIAEAHKIKHCKLEVEKPLQDSFQYLPELIAQKECTVIFKKDHNGGTYMATITGLTAAQYYTIGTCAAGGNVGCTAQTT